MTCYIENPVFHFTSENSYPVRNSGCSSGVVEELGGYLSQGLRGRQSYRLLQRRGLQLFIGEVCSFHLTHGYPLQELRQLAVCVLTTKHDKDHLAFRICMETKLYNTNVLIKDFGYNNSIFILDQKFKINS